MYITNPLGGAVVMIIGDTIINFSIPEVNYG